MMTNTELAGFAIASALENASNWGKDQAQAAINICTTAFKAGKVDASEFSLAVARLGNHSATRQHLEKHGLLKTQPDALALAIIKAQADALAELDKATS